MLRGNRANTLRIKAYWLERLDGELNGKRFREASEEDLLRFVESLRSPAPNRRGQQGPVSPSRLQSGLTIVGAFLRWLYDDQPRRYVKKCFLTHLIHHTRTRT